MSKFAVARSDDRARDLTDLLRAIATEDRAAFRQFRQATMGKVMTVATRIVGDHHAAEDVTQVVYLTVWRRAGTFDGTRGGAISWLSAITRNRALDHLRNRRAHVSHNALEAVGELADPAPTPYDMAELSNGFAIARARLDRLPVAEKDLLIAAVLEENSYPALALADNMPLPTLKSRVRRALMKLSLEPGSNAAAI